MRIRALDVNGDWTFGRGQGNYLLNNQAVLQSVNTRLNCFLDDCFFDMGFGIDWWTLLGGKSKVAVDLAARSLVLATLGVAKLLSFSVNTDSRRAMTLTYSIQTVFGGVVTQPNLAPAPPPFPGVSKFLRDLSFTGQTFIDVDVSGVIIDARYAVWILYDVGAGYAPVLGAAQPLNAGTVRVTMTPGPTGVFRLIGIA